MKKEIRIDRFGGNPLLVPNTTVGWMSLNIFNCGVILGDDGVYRMLVRGSHTNDQSKSDLGLALSTDGIHWNLLTKPVLECGFNEYCTLGIRDPRIVKWIDGWYYVFTTVAAPATMAEARVGIFKTKDFLNFEWVGIPFDYNDANSAIFPETIDGWAYLLHRRPPHIRITRTKDLTLKGGWQDDQVLIEKDLFYPHPDHLDTTYPDSKAVNGVMPTKIGIAGPPIRTPKGWLVITHVVHRYDPRVWECSFLLYRSYSLSFILLDIDDPTKVLYAHPEAILWPEKRYEVVGTVPNVVFSCATVDPGGDSLYVYWGGADTVICGGRLYKKDLPMCYCQERPETVLNQAV